jgi:heptosyltransferase-2
MPGIERLLIRLPNWLGDLLLARPLLHALRRTLATAEIRVVGPRPLLELIEQESIHDRGETWPAAASERALLTAELRSWRPSAALVLPPSFSSAYFTWKAGARVRIGYRGEWRTPLLTHALRRPMRGARHLSEEYLTLGSVLGARPAPVPRLGLPSQAGEGASALLEALGLGNKRYAVLGPGALYGPAKRWGGARFASLARALSARGLEVVVCGTAAERSLCDEVAHAAGAANVAGRTDLLAQAGLCARAAVAVCNDSGLAHLSAAVGAPTVVVFGSTSSGWTAPLGERVRVVQHAPVCSPCFQRTCRIGYVCLEAIGVEEVARAVFEVAA